jgi:hypothetical protein
VKAILPGWTKIVVLGSPAALSAVPQPSEWNSSPDGASRSRRGMCTVNGPGRGLGARNDTNIEMKGSISRASFWAYATIVAASSFAGWRWNSRSVASGSASARHASSSDGLALAQGPGAAHRGAVPDLPCLGALQPPALADDQRPGPVLPGDDPDLPVVALRRGHRFGKDDAAQFDRRGRRPCGPQDPAGDVEERHAGQHRNAVHPVVAHDEVVIAEHQPAFAGKSRVSHPPAPPPAGRRPATGRPSA